MGGHRKEAKTRITKVPGAPWCLAPGASCLVPSAWCLVSGAWCLVPGAWCQVPSAWCLVHRYALCLVPSAPWRPPPHHPKCRAPTACGPGAAALKGPRPGLRLGSHYTYHFTHIGITSLHGHAIHELFKLMPLF
jgi:hypothetical protein